MKKDSAGTRIGLLAFLVLLCWAIWGIDTLFHLKLYHWGILPRTLGGAWGIFFAPFLHGGPGHLAANTTAFLILGGLVILGGSRLFLDVSVFVLLLSGVGIWLFGRECIHIGASGMVFGYFGFLLGRGWYERKFGSIVISILVALFFGGMIWGVLPQEQHISWEAHLFGFIAGILAAKFLFERRRRKTIT